MSRTLRHLSVRSNLSALKLYPLPDNQPPATIAMVFDRDQAIALATRLLVAALTKDEKIQVTGFRRPPRKRDGAYVVTVTYQSSTKKKKKR